MDHLLGDAKRLIQRLTNHDNSVDILISEATNLQNKLIAMRQYKEEVNKLNDIADHRPRSTLILGSQLENQRIQNLEQENRELSISLAEHQSALELIMNKYREQVLLTMSHKPLSVDISKPTTDHTIEMVYMKERIAEMARVMLQSAAIDDQAQIQEIEFIRRLQVENENLRELLEISGQKMPSDTSGYLDHVCAVSPNSDQEKLDFSQEIKSPCVSFIKTEPRKPTETADDRSEDSNGVLEGKEEELFKSLPGNKRYGGKKGQRKPLVFDKEDQNECTESNNNAKNKQHIQKLENLFKDPGQGLNDDSLSAMDPSESCFRAIISDIKPLDFNNIDINEKLSENLFENVNTSSSPSTSQEKVHQNTTNPFLPDIEAAAAAGKLSGSSLDTSSNITETSVLEFLDSIVEASSRGEDLPDSFFSGISEDNIALGTNDRDRVGRSTSPKKLPALFSPLNEHNGPLSELFTKKDPNNDAVVLDEPDDDEESYSFGNRSEEDDSVINAFSDVDKAFTDTSLEDAFGFLDDEDADFVDGDCDEEPESSPESSPRTSPVPSEHEVGSNVDGVELDGEANMGGIRDSLKKDDVAKVEGDELEVLDFLDDMLNLEDRFGEDGADLEESFANDNDSVNMTVINTGRVSIDNNDTVVDTTLSGGTESDNDDILKLDNNHSNSSVALDVRNNTFDTTEDIQKRRLNINNQHNEPDIRTHTPLASNGDVSDTDSEATCTDSEATLDADIDQTLSDFDSIFEGNDFEDDFDLDEGDVETEVGGVGSK